MAEPNRLAFSELAKFHPKQITAWESMRSKQFTLFGGTRGPGKSYWLRWSLLWLLLHYSARLKIPNPKVGLFCEDYPTLADRQITRIRTEFPAWLGSVKRTDTDGLAFYLRPEYGGGILALRNLDDPSKYMGAEFAALGIDQLEKSPVDTFDILRGSLRWPGMPGEWLKFLATANPGGIGHGWVKQYWIDRKYPDGLVKYAKQFAYIKALPQDNPTLSHEYWEMLNSLPERLRRAWLLGDWDVFAGQVFMEFSRDRHVKASFPIPAHWPRFRGIDWGYVSPFACHWVAQNPDNGRVYVYREAYETGLTDRRQARLIRSMTGETEKIKISYADPSMWTKKTMEDQTFSTADEYRAEGVVLTRADNDRLTGVRKVHEFLANLPDGEPGLIVFDECEHLIRVLGQLVADGTNPEDVDTRTEDHPYDSLRYALTSIRPIRTKIVQVETGAKTDPLLRRLGRGGLASGDL